MAVVTVAATAAAHANTMCNFGWQMPFMGFPAGGIFPLLMLAVLAYIAYKMYNASQQGKKTDNATADKNASLHILKNRLARGEIDVEEFEKLKQILQS